ncbi:MAG TPA: flagellar basal body rod C-terminal domain-containing protein, partial [Pseudomonadales bacterium]|nr:flagellar basal body rod C-terminal domain-containing protein [Pseudomonadales bacterium]
DANSAAVLVGGLPYVPGASNTVLSADSSDPDYFGFQLTLSGNPAAGDSFRIDYNSGAAADNRNARQLSLLQSAATVGGARMNYQQAYNLLVSGVGSTTRAARIDSESSSAVLEQTRARREQLSGVNLDEEAANLIRFEQAYNASAQVIAVARQVMDALFAAFR